MKRLERLLALCWKPIQTNAAFFVFIFALGWYCTQTEIQLHLRGAHPYELSAEELFFDLYASCVLLTMIPARVRQWVRLFAALLLYAVALADMFCYVRFESTLTPTMLMLCLETNAREAREFASTYLGHDLFSSLTGGILWIALAHLLWSVTSWRLKKKAHLLHRMSNPFTHATSAITGGITLTLFVYCSTICLPNKQAMLRLFTQPDLGAVEHELTTQHHAVLYLPIHRLAFALRANQLAAAQTETLKRHLGTAPIDSCDFRSPQMVLIIGESYNRHRSQLYGYGRPTTPRQLQRMNDSTLAVFTDVVAPWNLTSYVFKHALSLHAIGDEGEWCDAPLLPEVFRRAGYHVTFLTNQYVARPDEKVWDFTGGFFLNVPEISTALFDERNTRAHRYDEGLLADYDAAPGQQHRSHQLTIFHLMGQHVDYQARFPVKTRRLFVPASYQRNDLTAEQQLLNADYDNAVRYNDSIVDQIVRRFEQENAIVVYMPDHGEECFNDSLRLFGRLHSAEIDRRLAREEFEIPFWIWASASFRAAHPDEWQTIMDSRHRRLMTDRLAHTLLRLAGIHTPLYREELDVLSPAYDERRPRLLKNTTDYNLLTREE